MNIIAAQFDESAHADAAIHALRIEAGFTASDVTCMVLSAPGRNAAFPIGGDENKDAGASGGSSGALTGAAVGGVAGAITGVAAAALLGPIGAVATTAIGAYAGSLAGALDNMTDATTQGAASPRPAGVMVMVHTLAPERRQAAIDVLQRQGARGIEQAEGEWKDGTWTNFDPVMPPNWVVPPTPAEALTRPT